MSPLEQAVLKTVAYADIFEYPLTISEIYAYLVDHTLQDAYSLGFLFQKNHLPLLEHQGYFVLAGRSLDLIQQRRDRESNAIKLLGKAKQIAKSHFYQIPWVKLVAVTGSTAAFNADNQADIDLMVVTGNGMKWVTRAVFLYLLERKGERINLSKPAVDNAGKFCLNLVLDESEMLQKRQNLYIANEIARMKVLFSRDRTYEKFLDVNSWLREFLPNWRPGEIQESDTSRLVSQLSQVVRLFEAPARSYQFRKKERWEQVKTDHQETILSAYEKRLGALGLKR